MNLYPRKRRGYYCYAIMGNKFLCVKGGSAVFGQ